MVVCWGSPEAWFAWNFSHRHSNLIDQVSNSWRHVFSRNALCFCVSFILSVAPPSLCAHSHGRTTPFSTTTTHTRAWNQERRTMARGKPKRHWALIVGWRKDLCVIIQLKKMGRFLAMCCCCCRSTGVTHTTTRNLCRRQWCAHRRGAARASRTSFWK